MHHGRRISRRTVVGGLAGGIASLALAGGHPALGQRSRTKEATWESDDGALTATYDTEIWHDIGTGTAPSNGLTLATDPTYGYPRYWLSLGSGDAIWSSVEDAGANAQAEWFSQGMNGSIVAEEFTTDTAYGWVHYADFQGNPRTVSVIQYELDGEGGMTTVMMSIDAEAYETLDIGEVFDAVSLNDDSVFVIASQRTMIRVIEDAFTA